MSAEKSIAEVYEDRNLLALAFVRMAHDCGYTIYHYVHDEWAVVGVELPGGQVSWHMRPEVVPDWITECDPVDFDGHDRADKNARLHEFTVREF